MAEASISQEEFKCSVCLDLLKDPVTIPCGHSYCKRCITGCWDQEDQKRVYSCPQCRQAFSPRPALAKNTILTEMVEKLETHKRPADCFAGAGEVQCDVCTGRKHKAVKSCLVCLESYCKNHLEQHESFFKRKRHKVTDATGRLQEMICQKHNKIFEGFCRTDQTCICGRCAMDEHKNHDTVLAEAQRTEKQPQLKETQRSFQERVQQREKKLQQLREAVESKCSAQTAVEDRERIFTELIRFIERSRSEATQRIRDQEKTAVSRAEGQLERLEQEINDLRGRDAELEQLSHTQDHIHFLQRFQSLSAPPESTDVNDNPISSLSSFDGLRESVLQLRDKLEDFCEEELKKISDRVTFTNIVPKTRNDFLRYSQQYTLDLTTVNKYLRLSEDNRVITNTRIEQPYPDHPDRFDYYDQVLCSESVCGRCYWEIECSDGVSISVSYKRINRKGVANQCVFGSNDQSWSLICSPSRYSFRHNNIETELPIESISRRTETELPVESISRRTETELSVESISHRTETELHVESISRRTETELPVESISRRTETELPVESISRRTETELPVESISRRTETELPVESIGRRTETELHVESISRRTETELPVESIGRRTETELPVESIGRRTETELPVEFISRRTETELPVESISRRIGVYVDHSAGTLSFYSVSDTMSLIHTVQTTFTHILYPGFSVYYGSSVKLC